MEVHFPCPIPQVIVVDWLIVHLDSRNCWILVSKLHYTIGNFNDALKFW